MSAPSQQLPSIPKQTQVSLNYWNANTAVDGCEFETIFQEPIFINAGDSINVRNSSLDTSKLSNNVIILEEDVNLNFEWITYAMMKKSNMDLQNASNAGTFHDCWIYGKDRTAFFDSFAQIDPTTPSRNLFDANGNFVFQVGDTILIDNNGGLTPPLNPPNNNPFYWNLITPLDIIPAERNADCERGVTYQIQNNFSNNLIKTSNADPTQYASAEGAVFSTDYAVDDIDPFSIGEEIVLSSENVGWNPAGVTFHNGDDYEQGSVTPIGDGTDFGAGDNISLAFLNNIDLDPNFPNFSPIWDSATPAGVSLIQKTGYFANVADQVFIAVNMPLATLTTNTWYFRAVRANGDFDDDKITYMSPYYDWTRGQNAQLPYGNYLYAQSPNFIVMPTGKFKVTTLPPEQYPLSVVSTFQQYDYFSDYKMGVFVNPLSSYVLQSAGSYGTLNGGTSRFRTDNPVLETLCNAPYQTTSVCGGWNSGSTYPNATGMNAPIVLVDGKTLEPIKRSAVITLKAGTYTKEEIAVAITKRLAELQAPSSSVNYSDPTTTSFTTAYNNISVINSQCPLELQLSAGRRSGDPIGTGALYNTYPSFKESAVNPFQCELEMGADGMNVDYASNVYNLAYNNDFVFSNFNDPSPPQNPAPPNVEPYKQNIPMFMTTNAVINNTNYFDANGTKPPNIPVCFKPLINDFKVRGGNVNLNQQDPDYNGWWGETQQNPAFADGIPPYQEGGTYYNSFDTNIQSPFLPNFNATELGAVNPIAYQTGVAATSPIPHTILPCIMNLDSYYPYSAGMWGTSEFSVLYDTTKDQFSFNFLHTPIITNSGGVPTPSVVRSRTTGTNPYSNLDATLTNNGLNTDNGDKRTDVNERHSGIILTSLTSTYKSGANANFWEKLGFNINDVVLPSTAFDENGTISYIDFGKYTTSELYSISQNVNVLNSNSVRNNEQMVIRDTFTQFLNPNPQIPVAPAVNQPIPAGFNNDVLYASSEATSLIATNPTSSVLNELGGNILIEIVGYGGGSELQDKDAFAIKSIVSLYYLTGNTYLSSTGDSYTYYHQSTIPQVVSKLKVRLLNPITKKKLTNVLGNNNSIYLTFTQNQQITAEGSFQPPPPKKGN